MKKLIVNITGIVAGVLMFLAFLLPVVVFVSSKAILGTDSSSYSAYNFLSFSGNADSMQIAFTIVAILMFVLSASLIVVSLLRIFLKEKKKSKMSLIQLVNAFALVVVSILALIFVIVYVSKFNNEGIISALNNFTGSLANMTAKVGFASFAPLIISLVGAVIMVVFKKK